MTLFFYVGTGSDLGDQAVRLGTGFSFTEAADSGMYAMSQVAIDDPAGSRTITGHAKFRAIETACSWDSLFRGYFADRAAVRADSLLTGAARRHDATVYDLNGALQFELIRSGGKRPAETDTQRLAWLLGSGYLGPIDSHDDHVFGAGVDMDKADYTRQTAADVLSDCGQTSGCNYFAAWDDTRGAPMIHYYLPTSSHNTCSLAISNVLSDVDGSTVFAPSKDAKLSRDPSRVFSGVGYEYGEKGSAVYRTSATILSAIGHKRETQFADPSVRTAAAAQRKADKWLSEGESEVDTISVTLYKVPASRVNLIRAGQRISVRFTHLPGYETASYIRIVRRTVAQDGDDALHYKLDLELSTPKQGGTRVRHAPRPVPPDSDDGSTLTAQRTCLRVLRDQIGYDGSTPNVPIADSVTYGNAPPGHTTVSDFAPAYMRPYVFADCPPVFQGGWSGWAHEEQWIEVDPGSLSGVDAIRVTYTTGTLQFMTGKSLVYGYMPSADGPPSAEYQYTPLGTCDPAGGSFDIPASLLTDSATNYIVIAPGWEAARGVETCSGALCDGASGPLGPSGCGEYNSARLTISTIAVTQRVSDGGSGRSPWRSLSGDIDGSNRTYSLPDWNGLGIPQVRIGGVEYAAGTDFSYDGTTGTVTMGFAPWEGAALQGRWLT